MATSDHTTQGAEMIAGVPLETYAPSALAGLAVILVLTGKLIPRRTYDDKEHEAQEWRTESRIKDQQLAEKDVQLGHLAEVGQTVNAIMRALQSGPR